MDRNAFFPSTPQKVSMGEFTEADGKTYIYAVAHAALTAKTPYKVLPYRYGHVTAALADDQMYYKVGVPLESVASGAVAKMQIGGWVDDMIVPSASHTVTYALKIYDGAVTTTGAAFAGTTLTEFGEAAETTSSSTTLDVMLYNERIVGTT